ncbi:MAG: GGDEF domain-containing protein [Sphingopyxis sp.]|nr:MAG: GGDEF domain-containing protein [Sphingopyxis sp.]
MHSMLQLHRFKLLGLFLLANTGLIIHLLAGTLKPISDWNWLDIAGEGGSAALVLVWLYLLLKGRPAGMVTNLLYAGLACLFFALWMDTVDEFIELAETVRWDGWLESGPMPIGFVLLTQGIFHWHREQLAISARMRNTERVFREHRQFDKLTPLGDAGYFRAQLDMALAEARTAQQPLSLVLLDLDEFSWINRRHGQREGDRVLQVVAQQILLNLRGHDLLCRLAGDRFILLLPNTPESQARLIAEELRLSIGHLAYKSSQQGERIELSVTAVALMARLDAGDDLLEQLNRAMAKAKPPRLARSA